MAAQAGDWVTAKLPERVSIRLPPDWTIQDEPANARQSAGGNTVVDLAGLPQSAGGVLLQAYGDRGSVTISVIHGDAATQADVAALTQPQVGGIDTQFRADLQRGLGIQGGEMLEYHGTSKEMLSGIWSLVTRYRYGLPGFPDRHMESHRIFLGTRSLGLMLQFDEGAVSAVRDTLIEIKNSLVVLTSDN